MDPSQMLEDKFSYFTPQSEREIFDELVFNVKFPEVYDASMLKDFVNCPSMFYLRHVLGLRRRSAEERNDLNWGTRWHKLMELYHNHGINEAIAQGFNDWPVGLDHLDEKNRTLERMINLFQRYVERYHDQQSKITRNLRTEQYFEIHCPEDNPHCRFGGCGLSWCGRMDRFVERRGKLVVWDYKTTGRMGRDYFESHENGFQLPGYVWAANHMTTERVDTAVLDVLYCLKASDDFFLRTFQYTDARLLEWRDNVKHWISRIDSYKAEWPRNPERWPKNWEECTRYYRCSFADVHFVAPVRDTRLRILSEDYHEDRWDPSKVD